jgi:hypothetical protein
LLPQLPASLLAQPPDAPSGFTIGPDALDTTQLVADGARRIFCNRELGLGRMDAIGFDMDYTLAQVELTIMFTLTLIGLM